jgi:hypothetical protein
VCVAIGLVSFLIVADRAVAQPATANVTFSHPVQLPGTVLPAGIYSFRFVGDGRTVVVSDVDHRVLTTLGVLPTTRPQRGDIVVLRTSAGDAAPEVSALYPDGGTQGIQFVFPDPRK